MRIKTKALLGMAVVGAVAPLAGFGAPAQAAGTCLPTPADPNDNVAAVEMVGDGLGGATFTCSYKATGRGGITAATPNKWTMVNTRTGATVAAWNTSAVGPVQSTNAAVCPNDVIEITFSNERQPAFADVPSGTYGVIRAGGAGVAPYVDVVTPGVCDGI